MDKLGPLENTSVSEDPILNDYKKNTYNWSHSNSSNVDHLVGVRDIQNLNVDDTFLVLGRDNKKDGYSIYFDIQNQVFGIDNNHSFFSEVEKEFSSYWNSSYLNKGSRSDDSPYDYSMYDYSWNNYINSYIDIYLRSQIEIATFILSGSENYSESYISTYILGESRNSSGNRNSRLRTRVRRALNPKTLPTMKINMLVTEPSSKRSKG